MHKEISAKAVTGNVNYKTVVTSNGLELIGDEPIESGGGNTGMDAYQLLLASLGTCTAITLRMYAILKQWEVGEITVELHMVTESGNTHIRRAIHYSNHVHEEQKQRLLVIADKCPIHKILTGKITISTH